MKSTAATAMNLNKPRREILADNPNHTTRTTMKKSDTNEDHSTTITTTTKVSLYRGSEIKVDLVRKTTPTDYGMIMESRRPKSVTMNHDSSGKSVMVETNHTRTAAMVFDYDSLPTEWSNLYPLAFGNSFNEYDTKAKAIGAIKRVMETEDYRGGCHYIAIIKLEGNLGYTVAVEKLGFRFGTDCPYPRGNEHDGDESFSALWKALSRSANRTAEADVEIDGDESWSDLPFAPESFRKSNGIGEPTFKAGSPSYKTHGMTDAEAANYLR